MPQASTPSEYYRKHRPDLLKHIIGQPEAVKIIKAMGNAIPHAILFTGPSGVGKTTLARYVATKKLKCNPEFGLKEINASETKGIDGIRQIRNEHRRKAVGGDVRVYIIDECHGLTTEAQNAFLKMLEEAPDHVYFLLATTDPAKVIPTIKTRCTQIGLKSISLVDLKIIVKDIATKEKVKISDRVLDALLDVAGGSARQILVELQKIAGIEKDDDRIEALMPPQVHSTAMTIVNTLIPFKGRPNWTDAANAIMSCDEDLEKVRQIVLTCAAKQMVGGNAKWSHRAYLVILAFADPFFHSRKAGMLAACWQIFNTK